MTATKAKATKIPSTFDAPPPVTDPEGVAAQLLGTDEGEPQSGSPSSSTERVRRYRERKKAQQAEPASDGESIATTAEEIEETAAACEALWDLMLVPVAAGRLKPLEDEQAKRMGKAFAPLVKRYAPMLGRWQYEISAAVVLASVMKQAWRTDAEYRAYMAEQQAKKAAAQQAQQEAEGGAA